MANWKEKTLEHWDKINGMAIRRFGQGPLAEEAALAVINGLADDDWRRVRAFQGQASFVSFLLTISGRLLEDFARKRYGRVRPPLWVQTLGGFWQKLYQALCLERRPVAEAVEVVFLRQIAAAAADKTAIETAAFQLLARIPDCGMHQGLEVDVDDEMALEHAGAAAGPAPDQAMLVREKKEVFAAVFQVVFGREEEVDSDRLMEQFAAWRITLTPEEKLLLKLCYQDGLAVTDAGKLLGLNRFQVHGRMRRLLERIRAELSRTGLAKTIRSLLAG